MLYKRHTKHRKQVQDWNGWLKMSNLL
jgi:hypothetical protein